MRERGVGGRDRRRTRQPAERAAGSATRWSPASPRAASTSSTSASCRRRCSTGACSTSASRAASRSPARTTPPSTTASSCASAPSRCMATTSSTLLRAHRRAGRRDAGPGARGAKSIDRYVAGRRGAHRPALAPDEGRVRLRQRRGDARRAAALSRAGSRRDRPLHRETTAPFPNHHPDPTVPENLEDLIAAVRAKARRSASPSTATRIASAWWTAPDGSSGAIICSSSTRATCSRARAGASRSSST